MPSARLAPEAAAFYGSQSEFSDPGAFAALYSGLPRDPARLAGAARDLMIHRGEGWLFGYVIPHDRLRDDAETRYMDDILRIITGRNPAPLTVWREPGDRFVGVCRDFALLHCSLLRNAGVPARVRSGFADYFGSDGFHGDHMIVEYWDEVRGWLLADPQLIGGVHRVDFDPMDVPRDRFLVAGTAWQAIRAGQADAKTFGLADKGMTGHWFVAGNVRVDLAALNKVETLLWDIWGAGAASEKAGSDDELTEEVRVLYDRAAEVTGADAPFAATRELFTRDERLRTPRTVLSVTEFTGPAEVTLRS